jgi:hypothetical protein
MKQFLLIAKDENSNSGLERRKEIRPLHLELAKKMKESGNLLLGGAILDLGDNMRGSVMVVQFESEEGLKDWLSNEPYLQNNVWQQYEIHPFRVASI